MSGSVYQSEDDMLGAKEIIRLYGAVESGGIVRHIYYPDNFTAEIETTIARLSQLADDPLMKAIIISQAVPGTTEAFRIIKQKRPDILCLAGETHEDPNVIASVADLVVNSDFVARGYLIPHSAKELGANTLVHISFPRHMIYESISRRRAIMEEACKDLGIRFAFENAPDPTGSAGIEGARQFILEKVPQWIEEYGPDTAFFCTNDAHTEPLLRQIASYGGYFVEADVPSPLMGYPKAFGIDLQGDAGDWAAILKKVEDAVVGAGASGRMGTWAYSLGFCHVAGLAEFGKRVAEGAADISDTKTLLECYGKFSPGAKWNMTNYGDVPASEAGIKNYLLIYQDTYVFGKGYLGIADLAVPEKYFKIRANSPKKANQPAFHIGILTGSDAQGADDLLGFEEMIRLYGDADNGGIIRYIIYPDNFMDDVAATANLISSMADDPLIKVIVVNQAIPGTAEGFRMAKEKRPDIICLAGEAHEDADVIGPVADLVVNADFISRGYLIPHSAKELGARTFMHISFPRHMASESIARRYAIMEQTCSDLGLNFVSEEAPDPTGSVGVEGARQYILENVPLWIEKYGRDTAFFCTNDAHTEPLLRQIAAYGGYFVEADIPSPLLGFQEAFEIKLDRPPGDWQGTLKKIEDAVIKAGASGRMGTWAYSLGFCQTAGMVEFGKLVAEGRAKISDTKTLLDCFGKFSPGAKWNGTYYTDAVTSKPVRNFFLIYQDTYIFGKGYMGATSVEIPEEYLLIGTNHEVQRNNKEGL
jgi:DNA-binding LacI/PurR family transcriptional regulator